MSETYEEFDPGLIAGSSCDSIWFDEAKKASWLMKDYNYNLPFLLQVCNSEIEVISTYRKLFQNLIQHNIANVRALDKGEVTFTSLAIRLIEKLSKDADDIENRILSIIEL